MGSQYKIQPVILAGGQGVRLWPLSRRDAPKQFLSLWGTKNLYMQTQERVQDSKIFKKAITLTHNRYKRFLRAQDARILFEPMSKNTSASVALAVCAAEAQDILMIMPSDHVIRNYEAFQEDVVRASLHAEKGHLCLFGIPPTGAETRFGYIERGNVQDGFAEMRAFHEKPTRQVAKNYLANGYVWNGGIVMARADILKASFEAHCPDLWGQIQQVWRSRTHTDEGIFFDKNQFQDVPRLSFDVAVLEKIKQAIIVEAQFDWMDIGSWSAFSAYFCDDLYQKIKRNAAMQKRMSWVQKRHL